MAEANIKVEFTKNYTSPIKTKYDTAQDNAPDPSFEKVYKDADDKYLAARIIYATAGNDAYTFSYDAEGEQEIEDVDLKNLFIKGVICNLSDKLYAAKTYDETNGIDFGLPTIE